MLYFVYPQLIKLSGAERLILRLAAHVAQAGSPVALVTHYLDPACRSELDPSVRLLTGSGPLRLFRNHYLDAPLEYAASISLLRRIGPDAEAITFFGPPSLPALAWSKHLTRRMVPHLYFCYEPPRFIYDDSADVTARLGAARFAAPALFSLYKPIDRSMVQSADVLLANSEFGAERLARAYGRPSAVITHGVDLAPPDPVQVQNLRERLKLERKQAVLSVNYLHPRKRLDLFLQAFAELHDRLPETVALVVGAGPERTRLDQIARDLRIAQAVIFTGFVPDGELANYYALAALYLHTSRLESFGLSVLEASACGLPVISVDEGGPREIVENGQTGFLVAATAADLAAASERLLRDEPLREAMGSAARQRAGDRYSWDRGAAAFLSQVSTARPGRKQTLQENRT